MQIETFWGEPRRPRRIASAVVLAVTFAASGMAVSQEGAAPSAEELARNKASYEKKLEAPFVDAVAWRRTLQDAVAEAARRDVFVFGYFTRSYAPCPPCIALEQGPFVSPWWKEIAGEAVVPYLNVEARCGGVPDQDLIETMRGPAVPLCVLIGPEREILWEIRPTTREAFDEARALARRLQALRGAAKADPEDLGVAASRDLLDACGRSLRPTRPLAELDGLCDAKGVEAEVVALYRTWRTRREFSEAGADGARALAMFRAGRSPEDLDSGVRYSFYLAALEAALDDRDADAATSLLALWRGAANPDPRWAAWLDQKQAEYAARIEKLRAGER